MMNTRSTSIRTRILLWHGALLALVLTAFGVTAHRLNWAGHLDGVDKSLDEPLSSMRRALHEQGPRGGGPIGRWTPQPGDFKLPTELAESLSARGISFALWNRTGDMLARSPDFPQELKMPLVDGWVPFVTQRRSVGDRREAYVMSPPGECFLVAVSMEADVMSDATLSSAPQRAHAPAAEPGLVLLVEDDQLTHRLVRKMLHGQEVLVAETIAQAMTLFLRAVAGKLFACGVCGPTNAAPR